MNGMLEVNGKVIFRDGNDGMDDIGFDRIRIWPVTGYRADTVVYFVEIEKPGFSATYVLDPGYSGTGIAIQGTEYFGKDLHTLYLVLQNLENEKTLEDLE